jgi:hypothetical protein
MSMRRFTRLTNAFSKKFENLQAAVALHFAHYNLEVEMWAWSGLPAITVRSTPVTRGGAYRPGPIGSAS